MSLLPRSIICGLLLALFATAPIGATETILDSAKMPNRLFPQSEIQLIATDSGAIVRSIIDTAFPNKVFSKIEGSEQSNWEGSPDMILYVVTLREAFEAYKQQKRKSPLVIDFVAGKLGDKVSFRMGETQWRELHLSSSYIRKNQHFILKDVFGGKADALIEQLETLLK